MGALQFSILLRRLQSAARTILIINNLKQIKTLI